MMSILASKSQLHFYLIILCYTHPKYTLRCKSIIVNDCKLARYSTSVRDNGLIYFSNLSNVGNGYEIKMRLHIIFHKSPFVVRPTMMNSLYPIKYSINEWYIFIHIFILMLLGGIMRLTLIHAIFLSIITSWLK